MTLHGDRPRGEVGVRELHDQLSRYVRRAAEGHEVTVTMRGRPVARLIPASAADPLADLRARGLVLPPRGDWSPGREARPAISVPIDDLVAEQRR